MADTCQADIGLYLGGAVPVDESLRNTVGCPEAATVTLRAGCVHEHVKEKRYCATHGQVHPADARWFCRECAEAGHDCPITPEVVT
jgi:hypothetical protein